MPSQIRDCKTIEQQDTKKITTNSTKPILYQNSISNSFGFFQKIIQILNSFDIEISFYSVYGMAASKLRR